MFGWMGFLRKGREKRLEEARKAHERVRAAFTQRYLNFKTLLSLNDQVLEIINDMERTLNGRERFSLVYIRSRLTALSVHLFKIIQSLNAISGNRHQGLVPVFERIRKEIEEELEPKKNVEKKAFILPMSEVYRESSLEAGNKMANLGEVRNRLGLAVPDGFVITTSAYAYFLEKALLQEEINRLFQLLEPGDPVRIHETSAEIQKRIINAPLPKEVEEAILSAYEDLCRRAGREVRVSLRSSALGEDAQEASFAGQYRSVLNVGRDFLLLSYKEVAASKYSVPAISYRLNKGFPDEEVLMAVGCLVMVEPEAAGVMYSDDPAGGFPGAVIINAVPGLGKAVVDGSLLPDLFVIEARGTGRIVIKEIREKTKKFVCHSDDGVCLEVFPEGRTATPAIRDDQAQTLADLALRLEQHFGSPQDIEWAVEPGGKVLILQSRPLWIPKDPSHYGTGAEEVEQGYPLLLEGGVTASPGVACGPVFRLEKTVDVLNFPKGAVAVARTPLPLWAALLDRASALVTEQGGLTGHLAAVAREFKVPALMGLSGAYQALPVGEVITVDATHRRIYAGRVESLLSRQNGETESPMKGSPVYRILERVLKKVAPLNLTDPESEDFRPERCSTFHDLIRYAHEMALRELFDPDKDPVLSEKFAKKLVSDLPMEWWVIDLEGGIRPDHQGATLRLEDIVSKPLLALWAGLAAVPWQGPPPLDTRGFLSILAESTMDPSLNYGQDSERGAKNYALISENFCHVSTRLGFHFSTVEAYLGEQAAENYLWFYFKGGAADRIRKERRIRLIQGVLERFHFWVQVKGDMLSARLERQEKEVLERGLKVLGYLILHTRQLDMVLSDPIKTDQEQEKMVVQLERLVSLSR